MNLEEIFESEWLKEITKVDIKNEDKPIENIIWVSSKGGEEHESRKY